MPEEKKTVEVVEIETAEVKEESFETDGLLPEEIEMAREYGFVEEKSDKPEEEKKDGEHAEQPEPKSEENISKEEEKKVEPTTFEDVEKDEGKLKQYNPNEQALYWKWKSDKKKRQQALKDYEDIKAQYELRQVRETSLANKISKVQQALKGDNITVEMIQEIIGSESTEPKEAPLTRSELERIEAEKETKKQDVERVSKDRAERIETAEKIGKTKYQNFEELTNLANEVVSSDKTGTYKDVLQAAFLDKEIDEVDLVDRVVTIAKLHPEYGKKKETSEKKEDPKMVDRAIQNSKKKLSSAAVGSGNNKRVISHDDMTVDDAARLTTEQWLKLPDSVRQRLLMQ